MTIFILTSVSGAAITTASGGVAIGQSPVVITGVVYRLLEDHYINGTFLPASQVVSDSDYLPLGWIPTPNVDPLNTAAVNVFYAQGPRVQGLTRTQFTFLVVQPPTTYWREIGPNLYTLTGLGSSLPPLSGV